MAFAADCLKSKTQGNTTGKAGNTKRPKPSRGRKFKATGRLTRLLDPTALGPGSRLGNLAV